MKQTIGPKEAIGKTVKAVAHDAGIFVIGFTDGSTAVIRAERDSYAEDEAEIYWKSTVIARETLSCADAVACNVCTEIEWHAAQAATAAARLEWKRLELERLKKELGEA